ncbi:MAG: laccase domain-containing protein [Phycisphaeraceae bacterium]|nr:laccase domain-containing protein [Phycisphaerae bacterium]MBX3393631.1 laccase domain-containing protein [Phycisphaeraceae bacterium]
MPAPGLLYSPLLSECRIPHAFTTREGGVSAPPFDSLNFGNPMDLPPSQPRDPVENIRENFRRVLHEIGAADREVTQVYQVHGGTAHVFRPGAPSRDRMPISPPDRPSTEPAPPGPDWEELDFKADAIVTDDPSRVVAVRVADCVPVLLATEDGRLVAAVHAGWRGIVLNVTRAAVTAMRTLAAEHDARRDVVAAIGPCIGPSRFEVGPEVAGEFRRLFGDDRHALEHPDPDSARQGKVLIHLAAALKMQLNTLGITRIDTVPGCTASEPHRFFSHRREAGITGRMVGLIGPRNP